MNDSNNIDTFITTDELVKIITLLIASTFSCSVIYNLSWLISINSVQSIEMFNFQDYVNDSPFISLLTLPFILILIFQYKQISRRYKEKINTRNNYIKNIPRIQFIQLTILITTMIISLIFNIKYIFHITLYITIGNISISIYLKYRREKHNKIPLIIFLYSLLVLTSCMLGFETPRKFCHSNKFYAWEVVYGQNKLTAPFGKTLEKGVLLIWENNSELITWENVTYINRIKSNHPQYLCEPSPKFMDAIINK